MFGREKFSISESVLMCFGSAQDAVVYMLEKHGIPNARAVIKFNHANIDASKVIEYENTYSLALKRRCVNFDFWCIVPNHGDCKVWTTCSARNKGRGWEIEYVDILFHGMLPGTDMQRIVWEIDQATKLPAPRIVQ